MLGSCRPLSRRYRKSKDDPRELPRGGRSASAFVMATALPTGLERPPFLLLDLGVAGDLPSGLLTTRNRRFVCPRFNSDMKRRLGLYTN
jgi:hypothetical protein